VPGDYEVEVLAADEWGAAGPALPAFSEDVLDLHRPKPVPRLIDRWLDRLPRWSIQPPRVPTFALIAAIVAGLGIAILVNGRQLKTVSAPVPVPYSAPTPTLTPEQQAISNMVEIANSGLTLKDFVISDDVHPSCPRGPADAPDPLARIIATTLRYFPSYQVHDFGRGIDLAGICSIEVRAFNPAGSALLVTVVAPPNGGVVPLIASQANDRTTSIDVVVLAYGWRVEVGATGQTGEQPTVAQVAGLAEDSRLVW
jgi:hypothetical protein